MEFGASRLHGVAPIIAGIRLISEFTALPLIMISAMTVYRPAGSLPSSLIENVRSSAGMDTPASATRPPASTTTYRHSGAARLRTIASTSPNGCRTI